MQDTYDDSWTKRDLNNILGQMPAYLRYLQMQYQGQAGETHNLTWCATLAHLTIGTAVNWASHTVCRGGLPTHSHRLPEPHCARVCGAGEGWEHGEGGGDERCIGG